MKLRRGTIDDLEALVGLQQVAYARNQETLGVVPIPLQIDYRDVLATKQVWLDDVDGVLRGALIIEPHDDHLLIWSIATDPTLQQTGIGKALLATAETHARALGLQTVRLYTGTRLTHLVAWYTRHGYVTDRIEERPDRSITHMSKSLIHASSITGAARRP